MAYEGKLLGRGHVSGLGRGRVFHNEDNPTTLFFRPDRKDGSYLLPRTRITFIKARSKTS